MGRVATLGTLGVGVALAGALVGTLVGALVRGVVLVRLGVRLTGDGEFSDCGDSNKRYPSAAR